MASKGLGVVRHAATVFVAEQIHFANTLAGNDPNKRTSAMRKLRRYLQEKSKGGSSFTEDDFLRIWKGLFYCMWMSDKPLVQEELADEIGSLVHVFSQVGTTLLFIKGFFSTIMNEWYGIDYHRLEKFSMFVRRFLRQILFYCKKRKWNASVVVAFSNILESTFLSVEENEKEKVDVSLVLHFVGIFLEELAKAGEGKLPSETLLEILKPFAANLTNKVDERIQNVIKSEVFYGLIHQTPEAYEYEDKFKAWKQAGYPGSDWKDMVFVEEDDKRPGRKSKTLLKNMDPRAGGAHVFLPNIKFDPIKVAEMLETFTDQCDNKTLINKVITRFQKLAEGEYPFAKHIPKSWLNSKKLSISEEFMDDAAERLAMFKAKIKSSSKIKKLRNTVPAKQLKRKAVDSKSKGERKKLKRDQAIPSKNKENLPHLVVEDPECMETQENNVTNVVASRKRKKKHLTKGQRRALSKKKRREAKALLQVPADKEEIKQIDDDEVSSKTEVIRSGNDKVSSKTEVISSGSGDFKEFYVFKGLFSNNKNENTEEKNNSSGRKGRVIISAKRRLKNKAIPKDSHKENPRNLSNTHDSLGLMNDSILEIHQNTSENTSKSISVLEKIKSGGNIEENIPEIIKIVEPPPGANKKVNIVLQKNKAQAISEYLESVKQSPSVPHDGSKKPFKGVLKRSSIQSPINPFYKSPKTGVKKQKKIKIKRGVKLT